MFTPATTSPRTPGRRAIATVAIALAVLAGCSSEDIAESVIERQIEAEQGGDVDVDIDADGGSIRVSGEDGSAVIDASGSEIRIEDGDSTFVSGAAAEVPDDFPADVPTPDADLANVARIAEGERVSFSLTYDAEASRLGDMYASWRSAIEAAGFTNSFESVATNNVSAQFDDGVRVVTFVGSADSGRTAVQLIVAPV